MMMVSSGTDIGPREQAESESRQRPAGDGEADPFKTFAKVVGSRHVLEKAALRNLVAIFGRLSQTNQSIV